jgi:hypothetical protein
MSENRDRAGELMHRLTFDASWDGAMSMLADALDEAEVRGRAATGESEVRRAAAVMSDDELAEALNEWHLRKSEQGL